jgi:hypothetical protein
MKRMNKWIFSHSDNCRTNKKIKKIKIIEKKLKKNLQYTLFYLKKNINWFTRLPCGSLRYHIYH